MELYCEPLSPMAESLDSSSFCLYVLGVMEFEVPICDCSPLLSLLTQTLVSIPRFSSILVRDKKGVKRWERVEVKLENHIIEAEAFSHDDQGMDYAKCFNDYLSNMGMVHLSHSKPLWEVHILKYVPNTTFLFKVHHSIGDGYTLMGVLLSCLKRAHNPSLPVSFPSLKPSKTTPYRAKNNRIFSNFFNVVSDFGWSLLKSSLVKDDKTPIRSGNCGIEFGPTNIFSLTFPMERVKDIKSRLGVTVNDVITGIIFYGIRMYMQDVEYSSRTKKATLLPMLNMRKGKDYETANDVKKCQNGKSNWGNQFTYMHVSIPKLKGNVVFDPLHFVLKVHHAMNTQRRFMLYSLIAMLLKIKHTFGGAEAVGKHFEKTMENSSILLSNMIGPIDQLALANHPIKSLYFTLSGVPQSVVITIISYMGMLRVTAKTEEGFIDDTKLAFYVNNAFETMHKAAVNLPSI